MISLRRILNEMYLLEKMTFSQLFKLSDTRRKDRAKTVRVTSLPGTASENEEYWNFSYKSNPSTTGNRWRGRITFLKEATNKSADEVYCSVDCSCPDFRYNWAYANADKEASIMGNASLNKCNGNYPKQTNPFLKVGCCKHILSLKDYLKTKLNESMQPDINAKLSEVVSKNSNFTILVDE